MTREPVMEPDPLAWGMLKRCLDKLYAHGGCATTKCLRPAHDEAGSCHRCERELAEEFDRRLNEPMSEATARAIGKMIREGTAPHRVVKRRVIE